MAGFLFGEREDTQAGVTTARALEFLAKNGLALRLSEASTLRSRLQQKGYIITPNKGVKAKGRGTSYAVTKKGLADIHVASAKFRHLANLVPTPDRGAEDPVPVSGHSTSVDGGGGLVVQLITDNLRKPERVSNNEKD